MKKKTKKKKKKRKKEQFFSILLIHEWTVHMYNTVYMWMKNKLERLSNRINVYILYVIMFTHVCTCYALHSVSVVYFVISRCL
jgi:hypothetical protein